MLRFILLLTVLLFTIVLGIFALGGLTDADSRNKNDIEENYLVKEEVTIPTKFSTTTRWR